jgi:hypothetical protein
MIASLSIAEHGVAVAAILAFSVIVTMLVPPAATLLVRAQ